MSNPIQQLNQILGKTEPNESRESKTQKERKKERKKETETVYARDRHLNINKKVETFREREE